MANVEDGANRLRLSTSDMLWWVSLTGLHLGVILTSLRSFAPPIKMLRMLEMKLPAVTRFLLDVRDGVNAGWLVPFLVVGVAGACSWLVWVRRRHGLVDLVVAGVPLLAIVPMLSTMAAGLPWMKLQVSLASGSPMPQPPDASGLARIAWWLSFEDGGRHGNFYLLACGTLAIAAVLLPGKRVTHTRGVSCILWLLVIVTLPPTVVAWHAIPP